jgi:hypothetical protein
MMNFLLSISFLVAVLVLLVLALLVCRMHKRPCRDDVIEVSASAVCQNLDSLIRHEVRLIPVNAANYRMLDLQYYDQARDYFVGKGFKIMGDFEDADFKRKNPDTPIFLRILVSAKGVISAVIFHLHRADLGVSMRLLDLTTEFDNGTFIVTSKSTQASALAQPGEIQTTYSPNMTVKELVALHLNRAKEFARTTKSAPIRLKDLNDLVSQEKRQQSIKNRFLNSMTDEMVRQQISNISGGTTDEGFLKAVTDRVLAIRNSKEIKSGGAVPTAS